MYPLHTDMEQSPRHIKWEKGAGQHIQCPTLIYVILKKRERITEALNIHF